MVEHRYKPIIGKSVVMNVDDLNSMKGYCFNDNTLKGVSKLLEQAGSDGITALEMSYILTTGANWKGPIGEFRLTVNKEDANAVLSSCMAGLSETGPTTLGLKRAKFKPEEDIRLLLFEAHCGFPGIARAKRDNGRVHPRIKFSENRLRFSEDALGSPRQRRLGPLSRQRFVHHHPLKFGKRPFFKLCCKQAVGIDRTGHRKLPIGNALETERSVIGLIAHQNHNACPNIAGGLQGNVHEFLADALVLVGRANGERAKQEAPALTCHDARKPHRGDHLVLIEGDKGKAALVRPSLTNLVGCLGEPTGPESLGVDVFYLVVMRRVLRQENDVGKGHCKVPVGLKETCGGTRHGYRALSRRSVLSSSLHLEPDHTSSPKASFR